MMALLSYLGFVCFLVASEACVHTNWKSFSKKGFSTCPHNTEYIKSFQRGKPSYPFWKFGGKNDPISNLKAAECCGPDLKCYMKDNAICEPANWVHDLDKAGWATCPSGYFLHGLYRSTWAGLSNIEFARCCRPWGHPLKYSDCYEQNIDHSKGEIGCERNHYFIVGMGRSSNNKLEGLQKFKCCKLANRRPQPKSLEDVKQYVMDRTRLDLVWLAEYLGYTRCRGCGDSFVGDDFKRVGDSWEADTRGNWFCHLGQHSKRLKIHYKNMKFVLFGPVKWGKRVRQVLPPHEVDSGRVTNADPNPTRTVIDKVEESTRTVTHTTSKQWKKSHEVGVDLVGFGLGFTCGAAGGVGGRVGYRFKYEDSTTTTTSNQKSDVKRFRVHSEKTIPGYSQAVWRILMTRTRTTVPYTATVLASFPVEFEGILKTGKNYHHKYSGSWFHKNLKFQLGDDKSPFFKALQIQSSRDMAPWDWDEMKRKNGAARSIINRLVNKKTYLFTVSGQIENVIGTRVEIQWKVGNKEWPEPYKRDLSNDLPRVYPPAPEVEISTIGEPIDQDLEESE